MEEPFKRRDSIGRSYSVKNESIGTGGQLVIAGVQVRELGWLDGGRSVETERST